LLGRATTGTAADGIGGSQDFYITNDNGDETLAGQIIVKMTDVSDGAEYSEISKKILVNGALVERCEDVLRRTLDATDVANGYHAFTWAKTTKAKIISMTCVVLSATTTNAISNDWTLTTSEWNDPVMVYNGSNIRVTQQGGTGVVGDIITLYVVYEK